MAQPRSPLPWCCWYVSLLRRLCPSASWGRCLLASNESAGTSAGAMQGLALGFVLLRVEALVEEGKIKF